VPKDFVGEIHLACTKGKTITVKKDDTWMKKYKEYNIVYPVYTNKQGTVKMSIGSGKVVAKVDYDYKNVERISYASTYISNTDGAEWYEEYESYLTPLREILKKAVLSYAELENYGKEKDVFAIPLTNLAIFNKPRELGKYYTFKRKTIYSGMDCPPYDDEVKTNITRCPQSYQFAYVEEE
jgi:predicted DNA binding protein